MSISTELRHKIAKRLVGKTPLFSEAVKTDVPAQTQGITLTLTKDEGATKNVVPNGIYAIRSKTEEIPYNRGNINDVFVFNNDVAELDGTYSSFGGKTTDILVDIHTIPIADFTTMETALKEYILEKESKKYKICVVNQSVKNVSDKNRANDKTQKVRVGLGVYYLVNKPAMKESFKEFFYETCGIEELGLLLHGITNKYGDSSIGEKGTYELVFDSRSTLTWDTEVYVLGYNYYYERVVDTSSILEEEVQGDDGNAEVELKDFNMKETIS